MGYAMIAILIGAVYFIFRSRPQPPAPPNVPVGGGGLIGPPAPPSTTYTPGEVVTLIRQIADEEDYARANLAVAIAMLESGLKPRALNATDRPPSVGVMGLKVPTARAYVPTVEDIEDLYDPATNIRAGVRFLEDLERKWIASYQLDGVIQMYNLGETRFLGGERNSWYLSRVRANLERVEASAGSA